MIYPTLHISPDAPTTIQIIDTDFEDNPVMSIQDESGDAPEAFMSFLRLFMNQYTDGYNTGYEDGLEDGLDGEIMDGEYEED